MIPRLEATRYRCFEHLGFNVDDFRSLVGANGSRKIMLLDPSFFFGDLLRANVSAPFMERRLDLPPRTGSLSEMLFVRLGSDFSLAVEARLPHTLLAMPRVLLESETRYPPARWLKGCTDQACAEKHAVIQAWVPMEVAA